MKLLCLWFLLIFSGPARCQAKRFTRAV
jgi:hypothetical protein